MSLLMIFVSGSQFLHDCEIFVDLCAHLWWEVWPGIVPRYHNMGEGGICAECSVRGSGFCNIGE